MDLHIRGIDVPVTQEMRDLADRHGQRIERMVANVVDAKLELRRQSQRNSDDVVIAQVTLQTGKSLLRAEEREKEPSKAVDRVFAKLERQVRKHHERRSDRHGPRELPQAVQPVEAPSTMDDEADGAQRLVRTKRFPVKPMDADEAIDQMELLGHDFFLFQDVDGRRISLVYRRRDGSYGLLVPEPM